MTFLPRTAARPFDLHGVRFHSFASGATGSDRLVAWRADIAEDTPGQPHTMTEEEVLYVLAGELEVDVDSEHVTARSGDAVLVPAGARFCVTNATSRPASAWVTSVRGMRAELAGGEQLAPPWAQ